MTTLRFIRLLALSLWLGSIFFFAAVLAPAAFSVLPSRALAGEMVSNSLFRLHWIGIACGVMFLLCCLLLTLFQSGTSAFHGRDILMVAMLAITLAAHYGVERKMVKLRNTMGAIDTIPKTDVRRVQFNRLHVWSERMEESVFVCGVLLMFLVIREQANLERRY